MRHFGRVRSHTFPVDLIKFHFLDFHILFSVQLHLVLPWTNLGCACLESGDGNLARLVKFEF